MQPGARRRQLDETLRTAYSEGLLSESTFMTRLDQVRGGTWVIRDIGSKNGTVLNGRTIERAQLRPGDYVSFAKRTFRVD
jgi:hypothetical protein